MRIKKITSKEDLSKVARLLYKIYIEEKKWQFKHDNPSGLRVECDSDGNKLLLDRFTDIAIWFGAFDGERIVACARICGVDEDHLLEVERYPNSAVIKEYLPKNKQTCFDLNKVAVDTCCLGGGVVIELFNEIFTYCEVNRLSLIAFTYNKHLKFLLKKIEWPLIVKNAFKYEDHDLFNVDFYYANYYDGHIKQMLRNISMQRTNALKSSEDSVLLRALDTVAPCLPVPLYWHDVSGVVLGINDHALSAMGATREIIGKNPFDFYPNKVAEYILEHNKKTIELKGVLSQEEMIRNISTGELKYFLSIKAPLYENGKIIGVVGTSLDITSEKEKIVLEQKLKAQEIKSDEQSKFHDLIAKMVHDIKSPLISLMNIVQSLVEVPDQKRYTLKSSAMTIESISNNMLKNYTKARNDIEVENYEVTFLYQIVKQVILEKEYEFSKDVKFTLNQKGSVFDLVVKIKPVQIKRMLSNIINNAVEAVMLNLKKEIIVNLDIENLTSCKISIIDNGIGMNKETLNRIKANAADQTNAEGIGMLQIKEAVNENFGRVEIISNVGHGTEVSLFFPLLPKPYWVTPEIKISNYSKILILCSNEFVYDILDQKIKQLKPYNVVNISCKTFFDVESYLSLDVAQSVGNIYLFCDDMLEREYHNSLVKISKYFSVKNIYIIYADCVIHPDLFLKHSEKLKYIPQHLFHEVNIYPEEMKLTKKD